MLIKVLTKEEKYLSRGADVKKIILEDMHSRKNIFINVRIENYIKSFM